MVFQVVLLPFVNHVGKVKEFSKYYLLEVKFSCSKSYL